jgi:hypothetical protein
MLSLSKEIHSQVVLLQGNLLLGHTNNNIGIPSLRDGDSYVLVNYPK